MQQSISLIRRMPHLVQVALLAAVIALLWGVALWYALSARGSFAWLPLEAALLTLPGFFALIIGTGLTVSAVLASRKRTAEALQKIRDTHDSQGEKRAVELEGANIALREDISARDRAEELLVQSEQRMRLILDTAYDAFVGMDSKGIITAWNAEAARLFGWSREQAMGRLLAETIIPPQFRRAHAHGLQRFLASGEGPVINKRLEIAALHRDGHEIPVELTVWPVPSDGGYVFNAFVHDISERKQAEKSLRESEQRFRSMLDSVVDYGIFMLDADGRIVNWNLGAERITGYRAEDVIGKNLSCFYPREGHAGGKPSNPLEIAAAKGRFEDEGWRVRKDGTARWTSVTITAMRDEAGALCGFCKVMRDLTEHKRSEERLTYLAQFDSLTSLPNRHMLHDKVALTLEQAQQSGTQIGCMFIDLDHFKAVNDTLGHNIGDKLLIQAARRLQQCVRSGDTVGRLGGDEFAIVLSSLGHPTDADLVAQKVVAALAAPFDLDGHETFISASLGIAIYPQDGASADELLKKADSAMYQAKEEGRNNFKFYLPEMHERAMQRIHLAASLHGALERHEFVVHYQPKADVVTGDITGFEALLRWQHPERGLVYPEDFIAALEDTGLIVPVGQWVLETVCAQLKAWQVQNLAVRPIAINLSARQFHQKNVEVIIARITNLGIDPALLEFELAESLLMSDAEVVARTLSSLKMFGVRLCVDDFGTSYSSLAYLKRFPLDALKIDSVFIRELTINPNDADITQAIISLAHSLRLKVVAEGVETGEQLSFLRELKCNEIQGYFFARPMSGADCTRALIDGRRLEAEVAMTKLPITA